MKHPTDPAQLSRWLRTPRTYTSDRTATLVRTRTGIVIGGAFVKPPPAPGSDAERIQAALLRHQAEVKRTGDAVDGLLIRIGIAVFAVFLVMLGAHVAARML